MSIFDTGLDKMRELVLPCCSELCEKYAAANDYGDFNQAIKNKCKNTAAYFYRNSNRDALVFKPISYYETLANNLEKDSVKLNKIASCLFGSVLGALYCKTYNRHKETRNNQLNITNKNNINLKNDREIVIAKIKEDIAKTNITNKKIILEMAKNCIYFLNDPVNLARPEFMVSSEELGKMAYALVDQKIENEPFPIINIFITNSLLNALFVYE